MQDDTIETLYTFLDGRGELPARVTNAMLLFAIRAERETRQADDAKLAARVATHAAVLDGKAGEMTHGLRYRVLRLERLLAGTRWLVWPLVSAFLGALGSALFQFISD